MYFCPKETAEYLFLWAGNIMQEMKKVEDEQAFFLTG